MPLPNGVSGTNIDAGLREITITVDGTFVDAGLNMDGPNPLAGVYCLRYAAEDDADALLAAGLVDYAFLHWETVEP